MDADDIRHLENLQQIIKNRLGMLELQQARFGYSTPAEIDMEIAELKTKLSAINNSLNTDIKLTTPNIEDAIEGLAKTDESNILLIDKILQLIVSLHVGTLEDLLLSRSTLILTMLTMLLASLFTNRLTIVIIPGLVMLILQELIFRKINHSSQQRYKELVQDKEADAKKPIR